MISNDGSGAIARQVDQQASKHIDAPSYFDLPSLVTLLEHSSLVALQFPDSLLPSSLPTLAFLMSALPNNQFFILADTSHNPCCVDSVAASHGSCDTLVHFGPACSSRVSLPANGVELVFYVYGRDECYIEQATAELQKTCPAGECLMFYHVSYEWVIADLVNTLTTLGYSITVQKRDDKDVPNNSNIIYIGPTDGFDLVEILMTCSTSKVFISCFNFI
jgi:diphthamide biosynthesis enzyme Dph1/Dph2-like protein